MDLVSNNNNQIELAPKPKKGFMRKVYEALESGPMTRQQIRLAINAEHGVIDKAISNLRSRGYLVYGKHNHRFAIAPVGNYRTGIEGRKRERRGGSTVSVVVSDSELRHIDKEIEKRKARGEKGATRAGVIRTSVRSYFRKPTKKKTPVVAKDSPNKWWKFWGKS